MRLRNGCLGKYPAINHSFGHARLFSTEAGHRRGRRSFGDHRQGVCVDGVRLEVVDCCSRGVAASPVAAPSVTPASTAARRQLSQGVRGVDYALNNAFTESVIGYGQAGGDEGNRGFDHGPEDDQGDEL